MAWIDRSDEVAERVRWPVGQAWHGEAAIGLEAMLARLTVPGVAMAVLDGGDLAWRRAWGVADTGSGRVMRADSLLLAGSMSKSVAAVAALCLVRDGHLALDEPIDDRLVRWHVPANGDWRPRITLRQLLSHTAGLTVHGFPGYGPHERVPSVPDLLDGNGNTPPVRVASLPGFQFSYSGGGYTVMQQLLEDVTGLSFPALTHDLVLAPLGMGDSTYEQHLPPLLAERAARGHRSGGVVVGDGAHRYPEMAAAGLWTTPTDLLRFVGAVQASLSGEPGAILPQALADGMLAPVAHNVPYGLGFFVEGEGPRRRFSHGGADEGFRGEFVGFAEGGRGLVVMVNSDLGRDVITALTTAVTEVYGWPRHGVSWPVEPDGPSAGLADPQALAGTYEGVEGSVVIARAGDRLVLRWREQPDLALDPGGSPGHFVASALNLEVSFQTAGPGIAALELRQAASYTKPSVFRRVG